MSLARYYLLALLFTANCLNYFDRTVMAVMLEPIKREFSLSDSQLGALSGLAFSILYALAGLPLGRLADRRDRRLILSGSLFIWSLMTSCGAFATTYRQLFLTRIGVGFGEAGCMPAAHSLIADSFEAQRRSTAISLFTAGSTVGAFLGLFAGGILLQKLGWRDTLMVAGVPGLALAALIYLSVRDPRTSAESSRLSAEQPRGLVPWPLLRSGRFLTMVVAFSAYAFGAYGASQWQAAYLMRNLGATPAQVGTALGFAAGLGGLAGLFLGGFLGDRLQSKGGPAAQLRFASAAAAVGFLAVASAFTSHSFGVAVALIGLGSLIASMSVSPSYASTYAALEPAGRATAAAVIMVAASVIGLGGGPLAVGMLSDAFATRFGGDSLRVALALVSLVPLIGAACMYRASRYPATPETVS